MTLFKWSIKWKKLRVQFLKEYIDTGISLKSWCKNRNISVYSARRYIKVRKEERLLGMRKSDNAQMKENTCSDTVNNTLSKENQHVNDGFKGEDVNNATNENSDTKKQTKLNKEQLKYISDNKLEFIQSVEEAEDYELYLFKQKYEKKLELYSNRLETLSLHNKVVELQRANKYKNCPLTTAKIIALYNEFDNGVKQTIFLSETIENICESITKVRKVYDWMKGYSGLIEMDTLILDNTLH